MTSNNQTINASKSESRPISLEELDLVARRYHHLHDEEVAKVVTGFFKQIGEFLGYHDVDGHRHPAR